MKTVKMNRDHDLKGTHHRTTALKKDQTYQLEDSQTKAVVEAGAGEVVKE